jgi:hypothetical protein
MGPLPERRQGPGLSLLLGILSLKSLWHITKEISEGSSLESEAWPGDPLSGFSGRGHISCNENSNYAFFPEMQEDYSNLQARTIHPVLGCLSAVTEGHCTNLSGLLGLSIFLLSCSPLCSEKPLSCPLSLSQDHPPGPSPWQCCSCSSEVSW